MFSWRKRRNERKKDTRQRRRVLSLETMEDRRLMAVTPGWFAEATPQPASAVIGPALPATESVAWEAQSVTAFRGEWIVNLTAEKAAKYSRTPTSIQALTGAGFQIVRGLGNQGQLLVRTRLSFDAAKAALAGLNGTIARFEPNAVLESNYTPTDPMFRQQWGLENARDTDIDASQAWDRSRGNASVVVAIVDTGIDYTHPDLAANMWRNPGEVPGNGLDDDGNGFVDDVYGYDFANRDSDPWDDYGHGTHVAGIVAADDNGLGIVGVAPDTKVMALKFMGSTGSGSAAAAINALNYATMMRSRNGVNIVATNNSWGGGGFSRNLKQAIDEHGKAGILFVAAAGNDTANTDVAPTYPAGYDLPNVIAVGATNAADAKSGFSNYGRQSVDLFAPGAGILSTLPHGSYGSASGTSMAAPHVAGAVALAAAVNPSATMAQLRDAVLSSIDYVPALENLCVTSGRLNAARTIQEIKINRDPVAVSDQVTVKAGKAIEIAVRANDFDPDGDAISVHSFTTVSENGGSVERKGPNRSNVLVYTPRPGFEGPDRFQYTISDGRGGLSTTVVNIEVQPVNRLPIAERDRATVQAGKSVEIPVLANDSDPDGHAINVQGFNASSVNGGKVERKGPNRPNVLVYTPRAGFSGTDRFQYTIGDGQGGTATAFVEIEVRPAPAVRDPATLVAGERLLPGQEIRSADGRYRFTLQHDGNLVLYGPARKALWSTRTAGKAVTAAVMQSDGNFVLYNNSQAVWHTHTADHGGARLVVLETGDVVIKGPRGKILWQAR